MRVAHLMHQSRVGAERLLVRLLAACDRELVEPLAVLPADGPLRKEIEALGVPVHITPLAWWIPATSWDPETFCRQLEGLEERASRLTELLEAERVELVHTQFLVTLEGALAAARLGLPHVWHSRGLFGDGFPPAWFDGTAYLLSVVDRLADAVLCMTRRVEEQMAMGCQTARTRVVYDGLDFTALQPPAHSVDPAPPLRGASRVLRSLWHRPRQPGGSPDASGSSVRARHGIGESARVVLTVGGIQRRKGQLDLVEAAAPLVAEFPDLVFVLVGRRGDSEYASRLTRRIAELRLEPSFRCVEFEPELVELFATAEVFVHPSHSEGFGLVVLEAMAMGLPVVVTRCGGPEEIVEDSVNGVLVPVRSPGELTAAVRKLLAEPMEARAMGRAAAVHARTFSMERTARQTVAVYRELLATSPARQDLAASRGPVAATVVDEILALARRATASSSLGRGHDATCRGAQECRDRQRER